MNADFLDLLFELCAAEARFLVVGGYAVGVHGRPRATKDLDLWIEASLPNAQNVILALQRFGAPLDNLTAEDLARPGTGFMMGLPPRRVDLLTQLPGVDFEDAWAARTEAHFRPDLTCPVIGLEHLLRNKRAVGRPQDLADVAALERIRGRNG